MRKQTAATKTEAEEEKEGGQDKDGRGGAEYVQSPCLVLEVLSVDLSVDLRRLLCASEGQEKRGSRP